jgi:hypothetical protein
MGFCPGQKRLATDSVTITASVDALHFALGEVTAGQQGNAHRLEEFRADAVYIGARDVLRRHRRLSFGGEEHGVGAHQGHVGCNRGALDGRNLREAPHHVVYRNYVAFGRSRRIQLAQIDPQREYVLRVVAGMD